MPGNWGLIDLDTPQNLYTKPSYHDPSQTLQLVFSDEFNTDGRTFYPGDDPYWEAVDLHYWQVRRRLIPLPVMNSNWTTDKQPRMVRPSRNNHLQRLPPHHTLGTTNPRTQLPRRPPLNMEQVLLHRWPIRNFRPAARREQRRRAVACYMGSGQFRSEFFFFFEFSSYRGVDINLLRTSGVRCNVRRPRTSPFPPSSPFFYQPPSPSFVVAIQLRRLRRRHSPQPNTQRAPPSSAHKRRPAILQRVFIVPPRTEAFAVHVRRGVSPRP